MSGSVRGAPSNGRPYRVLRSGKPVTFLFAIGCDGKNNDRVGLITVDNCERKAFHFGLLRPRGAKRTGCREPSYQQRSGIDRFSEQFSLTLSDGLVVQNLMK